MAFDVKAWTEDPEFAFSDEEKVEVLARFSTASRAKALEGNQLRQTDYSKKMNAGQADVAAAQKKVDEADAKLTAELSEWSKVQGAGAAAQAAADKRVAALEQQLLMARQTVERIAQVAAIDPAEYLQGLEVQPAPANLQPKPAGVPVADPPDLTSYAKTADVAQINKYLFETAMALPGLAAEHQALTGESLDTAALGAEIQRRAQANEPFDPRDVWEAMHGIPAKRTAVAKTQYDADIEAAEARGREAAASEHALPGGSPVGKRALVFQPGADGEPHKSALERPQPNSRTDAAVAALATGKYRQAPGAGAPHAGAGAASGAT